jgi:uncharacterized protein YggE
MPKFAAAMLLLFAAGLQAQTLPARTVTGTGNATVMVSPDQVQIDVGVVTQGTTAQDAAQQNATLTTAVSGALKTVLGTLGTIQTTSYSVYPRYNNPGPGQNQSIIGYSASSTMQVTSTDISLAGRLIDTANQAGANSVGGLTFGLRDPEPVKQQALTQAAKQALAHAGAIAAGLNAKVGAVVSASEGASYTPIYGGVATATTTPILTGTVRVDASVTVNADLVQ